MSNALVIDNKRALMPIMEIGEAVALRQMFVDYVKAIMVENVDYGIIPGASKPSLQKPGAEKLASFFGLAPSFEDVSAVEDWTGAEHGGEPFFYYRLRCHLYRDERRIASADGSCNSWETKYRYRNAERVCPNCGKSAIIKGKAEYGGGWVCFAKKGGCGAKYADGDSVIEGQQVGRIPNPDPAEQVNTFLKIAQKRALVAAVLIAVNASEFFTQDIEDMVTTAEYRIVDAETGEITTGTKPAKPTPAPKPQANGESSDPLIAKWLAARKDYEHAPMPVNGKWGTTQGVITGIVGGGDDGRHRFYSLLFGRKIESANDLTAPEAAWLVAFVKAGKAGDGYAAEAGAERAIASFMQRHPAPAPAFPAAADLHPESAHQSEPA